MAEYFAAIHEAIRRLSNGDDKEALHVLRLCLRKFHTFLVAFDSNLKSSFCSTLSARIKKLYKCTNKVRDLEVERKKAKFFSRRLKNKNTDGFTHRFLKKHRKKYIIKLQNIKQTMPEELEKLHAEFKIWLDDKTADVPSQATFEEAFTVVSKNYLDDLICKIGKINSCNDVNEIHDARLSGKRLRCLLEISPGKNSNVDQQLIELTRLQDLLGELHDSSLLLKRLDEYGVMNPTIEDHEKQMLINEAKMEQKMHFQNWQTLMDTSDFKKWSR